MSNQYHAVNHEICCRDLRSVYKLRRCPKFSQHGLDTLNFFHHEQHIAAKQFTSCYSAILGSCSFALCYLYIFGPEGCVSVPFSCFVYLSYSATTYDRDTLELWGRSSLAKKFQILSLYQYAERKGFKRKPAEISLPVWSEAGEFISASLA